MNWIDVSLILFLGAFVFVGFLSLSPDEPVDRIDVSPVVLVECITPTTTTSTSSVRVTTTTLVCPTLECPPIKECPLCPECEYTYAEIKWMLNYKPDFGRTAYQSGGYDCKDDWLNYLEIPGRPRFKSRPRQTERLLTGKAEETFCFVDQGGYFDINRTPDVNGRKRWSWDDSQCKTSSIRIKDI